MAMGARSGESRKEVQCALCDPPYVARRDYMQLTHFPKKHPGKPYREMGERALPFMFIKKAADDKYQDGRQKRPRSDETVNTEENVQEVETADETKEVEDSRNKETSKESETTN